MSEVIKKSLLADFKPFVPVIVDHRIRSDEDKKRESQFRKDLRKLGYTTDRMIERAVQFWDRERQD